MNIRVYSDINIILYIIMYIQYVYIYIYYVCTVCTVQKWIETTNQNI